MCGETRGRVFCRFISSRKTSVVNLEHQFGQAGAFVMRVRTRDDKIARLEWARSMVTLGELDEAGEEAFGGDFRFVGLALRGGKQLFKR